MVKLRAPHLQHSLLFFCDPKTEHAGSSFTLVSWFMYPYVFCRLKPSSKAIANCIASTEFFWAQYTIFPGLVCWPYRVQRCRKPAFSCDYQNRILVPKHLAYSNIDVMTPLVFAFGTEVCDYIKFCYGVF